MKKELFLGLLMGTAVTGAFALESEGIFTYRVGQFEVSMLVERQNPGSARILVGADEAILSRYIPAGGFNQATNTYLIKAPGRNIIVDTGFGGEIFNKIRQLGVEPDQVDTVLLTHLHPDHIGGLQKDGQALFPHAKVYLSARELEYFTKTNVNQGVVAALAPYGSRVETFEPPALGQASREILPGVSAIAAYGHTPGHTVYLIENNGSRLLIIGDLLHVALVQFPHPEISVTSDVDQQAAGEIRRQILGYAAQNQIPVAGMHMVYPAIGRVEVEGGGFKFIPEEL
jgi:glyoxylase-like metal-dependent hydrolase (beta-lactamase superfamily II)